MPKSLAEPPRPPVAAGPRHEGPAAQPGGDACRGTGGAGTGGPRPGADRRAGGRRPRPRAAAGVGVRGRARLRDRHRLRFRASAVAACARSATRSTSTIQELYAYEHSTTDETTDEDEVGRMQGDLIDLEPALRDAVVLALPTNPLCRADCPGLCPECGVHWDDLPADHSHEQVDPRWAALSQLNTVQRSRHRGRPQAQDVAQQHPVPPGATGRRPRSRPWPARSAGRRSCRTRPARSAARTTAARSSRSDLDAVTRPTAGWARTRRPRSGPPTRRLTPRSRAPRGSPSTSSAGTMLPPSWLTALCGPAAPTRTSTFCSSARTRSPTRSSPPSTRPTAPGSRSAPSHAAVGMADPPPRGDRATVRAARRRRRRTARPTPWSPPAPPAPPSPPPPSGSAAGPASADPRWPPMLPAVAGPVVLLDVGGSARPDPADLVQHAVLGAAYAAVAHGVAAPGSACSRSAPSPARATGCAGPPTPLLRRHAAARRRPLRRAGRGHDVSLGDRADVVVTDGFTGNVLLKGIEGAYAAGRRPARRAAACPERPPCSASPAPWWSATARPPAPTLASGIALAARLHARRDAATVAALCAGAHSIAAGRHRGTSATIRATSVGGRSVAPPGGGVRRRRSSRTCCERALTHRSYAYENGGLPTNERLEFLGDSVLGVVITTALFHNHPDLPEGQLAKLRASVVNMRALADVARGLGPHGPRPVPAARQGRGDHRRPGQGEHPGRHAGGAARRDLPAARPGHRRRGDPPAVRPADGRGGRAGRRPGLEDQPAGADRGAGARACRSTGSRRPARTTPRRSPPGWWWPATGTAAPRGAARRRPSSGRPRRPGGR